MTSASPVSFSDAPNDTMHRRLVDRQRANPDGAIAPPTTPAPVSPSELGDGVPRSQVEQLCWDLVTTIGDMAARLQSGQTELKRVRAELRRIECQILKVFT